MRKIDFIRQELARIASAEDRADIFAPEMKASWSYANVLVMGHHRMKTFDYDGLLSLLKATPSGIGEISFWMKVDGQRSLRIVS